MVTSHPFAIVGIHIEGLFGYIDQRIEANNDHREDVA